VKHRRAGGATMKLIRYADDFVALVHGPRADAESLFGEVAQVLTPMGLRLSEEKTHLTQIEDGFDFLGWRIQRRTWRGRGGVKQTVYTYPSKKSLASIKAKIRTLTRRKAHRTLADLLRRLNPAIRGWCVYFQHGVSKRTFSYVDHFAFWRIVGWLKKRHPKLNTHTVIHRHLPGWQIKADGIEFFRAPTVPVTRYRGARIPNPWTSTRTA
jgi:RNA-directed DNA polymerase